MSAVEFKYNLGGLELEVRACVDGEDVTLEEVTFFKLAVKFPPKFERTDFDYDDILEYDPNVGGGQSLTHILTAKALEADS